MALRSTTLLLSPYTRASFPFFVSSVSWAPLPSNHLSQHDGWCLVCGRHAVRSNAVRRRSYARPGIPFLLFAARVLARASTVRCSVPVVPSRIAQWCSSCPTEHRSWRLACAPRMLPTGVEVPSYCKPGPPVQMPTRGFSLFTYLAGRRCSAARRASLKPPQVKHSVRRRVGQPSRMVAVDVARGRADVSR
jgi:hypothetical protein